MLHTGGTSVNSDNKVPSVKETGGNNKRPELVIRDRTYCCDAISTFNALVGSLQVRGDILVTGRYLVVNDAADFNFAALLAGALVVEELQDVLVAAKVA